MFRAVIGASPVKRFDFVLNSRYLNVIYRAGKSSTIVPGPGAGNSFIQVDLEIIIPGNFRKPINRVGMFDISKKPPMKTKSAAKKVAKKAAKKRAVKKTAKKTIAKSGAPGGDRKLRRKTNT